MINDSGNINKQEFINLGITNAIAANCNDVVGGDSDSDIVGGGAVVQATPCRYATSHLVAGITVARGCWEVAAPRIVI